MDREKAIAQEPVAMMFIGWVQDGEFYDERFSGPSDLDLGYAIAVYAFEKDL